VKVGRSCVDIALTGILAVEDGVNATVPAHVTVGAATVAGAVDAGPAATKGGDV
jgi:hypothetical protein